jgi:hypothetical protein
VEPEGRADDQQGGGGAGGGGGRGAKGWWRALAVGDTVALDSHHGRLWRVTAIERSSAALIATADGQPHGLGLEYESDAGGVWGAAPASAEVAQAPPCIAGVWGQRRRDRREAAAARAAARAGERERQAARRDGARHRAFLGRLRSQGRPFSRELVGGLHRASRATGVCGEDCWLRLRRLDELLQRPQFANMHLLLLLVGLLRTLHAPLNRDGFPTSLCLVALFVGVQA